MAKQIKATKGVVIKVAYTSMVKYNELYLKFDSNLNKLLAWLHGRSLNDALVEKMPEWGLLDQFTKQPLVQKYVEGKDFELRMRTKAEEDPVVAAASIVARATWLQQMKKLDELAGEKLPKGSGVQAKEKARMILKSLVKTGWVNFVNSISKLLTKRWGKNLQQSQNGILIGKNLKIGTYLNGKPALDL